MQDLLTTIRERLSSRQYLNETAVREGVVTPILRELGWDTFDPSQVRPEHANDVGRVDYALFGSVRRPAVFIEVKGVGRALGGDEQLFRYCFSHGVPLAVLTDGQSWNFYLPGGLGTIEDRRVYSLHLEKRSPAEAEEVLTRYLARERIINRKAFEAAREDQERAINQREARATLPTAWQDIVAEKNELLIELLQDKVEALCGFQPSDERTLAFLGALNIKANSQYPPSIHSVGQDTIEPVLPDSKTKPGKLEIDYVIFGDMTCPRESGPF